MDAKIGVNGGGGKGERHEQKRYGSFGCGGWLPVFASRLHGWWCRYGGLLWLGVIKVVGARNLVVGMVDHEIVDESLGFLVFDVHSSQECAPAYKHMNFRVKVLTFTAEGEGDVSGSSGRVGP